MPAYAKVAQTMSSGRSGVAAQAVYHGKRGRSRSPVARALAGTASDRSRSRSRLPRRSSTEGTKAHPISVDDDEDSKAPETVRGAYRDITASNCDKATLESQVRPYEPPTPNDVTIIKQLLTRLGCHESAASPSKAPTQKARKAPTSSVAASAGASSVAASAGSIHHSNSTTSGAHNGTTSNGTTSSTQKSLQKSLPNDHARRTNEEQLEEQQLNETQSLPTPSIRVLTEQKDILFWLGDATFEKVSWDPTGSIAKYQFKPSPTTELVEREKTTNVKRVTKATGIFIRGASVIHMDDRDLQLHKDCSCFDDLPKHKVMFGSFCLDGTYQTYRPRGSKAKTPAFYSPSKLELNVYAREQQKTDVLTLHDAPNHPFCVELHTLTWRYELSPKGACTPDSD